MNGLTGKIIGDIHVTVCKSKEGKEFFSLEANNKKVIHILDFLENELNNYVG